MNVQLDMASFFDAFAEGANPKKEYLEQLEKLIPWEKWLEQIRPYYYKGERGNKPYSAELMLRMFILQSIYNLSDMGTMYELLDSRAFTAFCGINSATDVPNGDTLGRFRRMLMDNGLYRNIIVDLIEVLANKKLMQKRNSIGFALLSAMPNQSGKR